LEIYQNEYTYYARTPERQITYIITLVKLVKLILRLDFTYYALSWNSMYS